MCISESSIFTSLLLPAVFLHDSFYLWTQMQSSPSNSHSHTCTHTHIDENHHFAEQLNEQLESGLAFPPQVPADGTTMWKACDFGERLMFWEHPVTQCYPSVENGITSCLSAFAHAHGLKRQNPGKSVTSLSPKSNGPHGSKKISPSS